MAVLSYAGGNQTLIMVSITGLQYPNSSYNFRFKRGSGAWNYTGTVNLGSFSGLNCGTSYSFTGEAEYPIGSGTWYSFGNSFSTDDCDPPPPVYPSPPSWTATSTVNSITTYVTFGANTDHVNVYLPDATPQTQTLYANGNVTHGGLAANTNYTLYIQAWDATETYGSGSQSYVIKTAGARPTNFSGWGITVSAGQPAAITAAKWLEFQAKINAFRAYKNLSAYGFTGASYVYTGADIEYWLANQLRNAIYDMTTSVPGTVAAGDTFTATWLNQLTNALNAIT